MLDPDGLLNEPYISSWLGNRENTVIRHETDIKYVERWINQLIQYPNAINAVREMQTFRASSKPLSRGQLFCIANKVRDEAASVETLLWLSNAWGGRTGLRHLRKELQSFYGSEYQTRQAALAKAFDLALTDNPKNAYSQAAKIACGLGTSFFTKFLYFVSFGTGRNNCLIFDQKVSTNLGKLDYLKLKGARYSAKWYQDYCSLLCQTALEYSNLHGSRVEPDEIERALFEGREVVDE